MSLVAFLPLLAPAVLLWNDGHPDLDARIDVEALIERADQSPIVDQEVLVARVSRDDRGKVTRLRLDGMNLTEKEFQALARIVTLRSLSLQRTNVGDADIARLKALPGLTGLNLNSTNITDAAIPHLRALPALRSLCLFNVRLSPEGVAELREACRNLGIGFRRAAP